MALRPQIDTAKYIIVNQKFKDLKIKSEKWFSEEKIEQWYTREYDTLVRITENFNQIFCGEQ